MTLFLPEQLSGWERSRLRVLVNVGTLAGARAAEALPRLRLLDNPFIDHPDADVGHSISKCADEPTAGGAADSPEGQEVTERSG